MYILKFLNLLHFYNSKSMVEVPSRAGVSPSNRLVQIWYAILGSRRSSYNIDKTWPKRWKNGKCRADLFQ